jgi:hypothetical protein
MAVAGCGTQTDAPQGVDAASYGSTNPSQVATDTVPPAPARSVIDRMHDVGIDAVGDPQKPGPTDVSFDTALSAALAENGGLMVDGTYPTSARFGRLDTPHFGATLGKGDTERVVPALAGTNGWALIYEDATVPSNGGRGPQFAPTTEPGADVTSAPTATVDLVVVIDGLTGKFLFARSLS